MNSSAAQCYSCSMIIERLPPGTRVDPTQAVYLVTFSSRNSFEQLAKRLGVSKAVFLERMIVAVTDQLDESFLSVYRDRVSEKKTRVVYRIGLEYRKKVNSVAEEFDIFVSAVFRAMVDYTLEHLDDTGVPDWWTDAPSTATEGEEETLIT